MNKITSDMPEAERQRWAVIRLDNFSALPGLLLYADEDTGECSTQMLVAGNNEVKTYALGAGGCRIVVRR